MADFIIKNSYAEFNHKKNPHSAWAKAGYVSLAVFLLRPQADFKSAHLSKIVNIYTNVNYLEGFYTHKPKE